MTHHIPNPIVLDRALPKCVPAVNHCPRAWQCASCMVNGDGRGRRDYTISTNWTAAKCEGWRDVADHRPGVAPQGPKVHDTPQGLW